jgi:hypothetical protein
LDCFPNHSHSNQVLIAMRRFLLLAVLSFALSAFGQAQRPSGLQPVPEPPPPPPGMELDPALEPQVTIVKRGADQVEEYRINGKLYMMKVTPPHGNTYYLIDRTGGGMMTRVDVIDPQLSVPMWVIKTF